MKKIRGTPKKKKNIPANRKTTSFPIVGIGASAGGLEAYQELLKNLSAKPGMAIVFIMHLAPAHKSMLTELLARSTKMPVREIKNGMLIEINHIYVIPPGTNVSIANGRLKLNKMRDAGLKRMPIDWFFRSLAEDQRNRSIGVILSGTATDGTLGAEAIKAEGGITFAQDEKSAKYGGMPQSAIAAGCADFVLSPKRIARELERIAKHPLISSAGLVKADKSSITGNKGLEGIFAILRSAKGLDFTHYKTTTIGRRISRRMVLLKLENLKSYVKFLRENKDEVENLYEDLLLKVTSFFRDPKVFHILEKRLIPAILKNKTKGQEVRIWVSGCSSGEEAYSIAISLIEAMGRKKSAVPVRIFATDVSESSINKARQGIYGKNIQNDVTPERLKRFFTKTGISYRVSKLLRDMCIFSKQNVFGDPPFSNLDLISCRNLIIYFQPVLQKNVFCKFHYALKPGGFLVLGNSESAGGYSNLFKTLDRKQRIFVKKYLMREPQLELGQKYYPPKKLEIKEKTGIGKGKETDIESLVERVVLSEYALCGVLIDSDMEVVQFRGHTGRYLESAAGKPSLNLFKLTPKGLFQPLRTAIYKARGTKHTAKIEAADVQYNGRRMRVNITVIPVKAGPLKEEFFLVLFDEIPRAARSNNLPKAHGKFVKDEKYVETLQKELAETKEYLQTIIEEQENVNEEVKTANEEILSSNEELLSTNEELETAKEELQSSNEELVTTNEELQNRNKEVVLLNNDLVNLLSSINMPVIMMGTDLVIRRITPQAEKALNVISSDIGRPINKIKLNVDIPDFEKILLDVIESLRPKTFEIKDKEENWYSVYIRPYRTLDNKINGVVAIFISITERRKLERELAQAREEEFRAIFDNAVDGILIADMESKKFYKGNNAICRMLGYSPAEIKNLRVMDIHPEKDTPYVINQFERQVKGEIRLATDLPIKRKDGSIFYADVNATTITIAGKIHLMGFFHDTTERLKVENDLRNSKEYAELLYRVVPSAIFTVDCDKRITSWNRKAQKITGYTAAEVIGNKCSLFVITPCADECGVFSNDVIKPVIAEECTIKAKDGRMLTILKNADLLKDEKDNIIGGIESFEDITERKQLEAELKLADELKSTTEMKSKFTSMVSHELRSPLGAIKEGINLVLEGLAGNINDEQKDLLDTAKRNTDRLGRLINNVLDFQKMESGKMTFELGENDINEAVLEVNKAMSFLAKQKGLDLAVDADDNIPRIRFDKDRIVQVLTNLVSNAIKYTEKGNITISTKQEDNTVHVIVRDTGMGIKAEDIEKLFQVFEQLDGARDKKKGGTGLGLAISNEIILAHKGKIWAESEAGKGSAFHFIIPRKIKEKKKIGEILIEEGKITENDLKKALKRQEQ